MARTLGLLSFPHEGVLKGSFPPPAFFNPLSLYFYMMTHCYPLGTRKLQPYQNPVCEQIALKARMTSSLLHHYSH